MSTQGDKLKAIADAIRAMDGTTGKIAANHFPARIRAISGDATAAAGDIASGKTAFVKGKKVTGTVETVLSGSKAVNSGYALPYVSGSTLKVDGYRGQDTLYRANGILTVDSQLSEYGDAAAEDVAEGKTFTSAAGLKVVGTAKIPGTITVTFETNFQDSYALFDVAYVDADGVVQTEEIPLTGPLRRSFTAKGDSVFVLRCQGMSSLPGGGGSVNADYMLSMTCDTSGGRCSHIEVIKLYSDDAIIQFGEV